MKKKDTLGEQVGAIIEVIRSRYCIELDDDSVLTAENLLRKSLSQVDNEDKDRHFLIEGLDNYSEIFLFKERALSLEEMAGIGFQFRIIDEFPVITGLIKSAPAIASGLLIGDKLICIDGHLTQGCSMDDIVSFMRGKIGTACTVSIRRNDCEDLLNFSIVRERITISSTPFFGVINNDIGYIRYARFSNNSAMELQTVLMNFQQRKVKSVILDLRSNSGGLLGQAIVIAEYFLEKGALIVSTRDRSEEEHFYAEQTPIIDSSIPMAVLVNESTASAAEILAGSLQENKRAVIIGEKTFGKGCVQSIISINDTIALKLTTQLYFLPSGRCIDRSFGYGEGICPDVSPEEEQNSVPCKISNILIDSTTTGYDLELIEKMKVDPHLLTAIRCINASAHKRNISPLRRVINKMTSYIK